MYLIKLNEHTQHTNLKGHIDFQVFENVFTLINHFLAWLSISVTHPLEPNVYQLRDFRLFH